MNFEFTHHCLLRKSSSFDLLLLYLVEGESNIVESQDLFEV
jgi:hypothetical protein